MSIFSNDSLDRVAIGLYGLLSVAFVTPALSFALALLRPVLAGEVHATSGLLTSGIVLLVAPAFGALAMVFFPSWLAVSLLCGVLLAALPPENRVLSGIFVVASALFAAFWGVCEGKILPLYSLIPAAAISAGLALAVRRAHMTRSKARRARGQTERGPQRMV